MGPTGRIAQACVNGKHHTPQEFTMSHLLATIRRTSLVVGTLMIGCASLAQAADEAQTQRLAMASTQARDASKSTVAQPNARSQRAHGDAAPAKASVRRSPEVRTAAAQDSDGSRFTY